jgi:RNA polymerase sigma-70 factor (ECF subfamily)
LEDSIVSSDEGILELFRKDRREAFRLLYDEYAGRLFSVCNRYIVDEQLAADLLHETMLKVYDHLSSFKYDGEGSLFRWMSRIAVNMILDKKKWARRHRLQVSELVWNQIPEPELESDDEIPAEEMRKMIGRLSPIKRAVFNMYCIEGYSHREIGSLLGISENGSSSTLSKAKKELAAMIIDYLKNNE